MTTGMSNPDQAVRELSAKFRGQLVRPGDAEYDAARSVFNGMIDRRPALIARCRTTDDVAAAVNVARGTGLLVSVKGGGHSGPGYGVCDGGLMIDLSEMKDLSIDAGTQTCRAAAGLTWGEFDARTQEHGLALTGGRVTSTGISGLTLGSGSGWLERKLGYTADSLLSAEVVTASGEVVRASEAENSDLFWGLRGGSGNFGVATSFEFRLHPVGPLILGGLLGFTRDKGRQLLSFWRDWIKAAPDDMGSAVAALTAPPEDFVPEQVRGTPVLGVVICWTGDPDEGQRLVQPLRDLGPAMDMVGPLPYTALQGILDAANPPGLQNYWKADMYEDLPDPALDAYLEATEHPGSPFHAIIIEPLGGAVARVPEDAMALSGRNAAFVLHALGLWQDPAENDGQIAWIRNIWQALKPWSMPGVHLNFFSEASEEQVRSTYGAKLDRLMALKRKYDPDNFFRMNQNITPA